jgi:pimeloyl-ACP methyl ester carboxylesterase
MRWQLFALSILIAALLSGCASGSSRPASFYPSPGLEHAFHAMYDQRLDAWPVAFDTLRVPTSYGTTYVIASGPADAPPVVLLHAMGVTATMWLPNLEALSRRHRVYAVDLIGDLGRSELHDPRVHPRNGAAYSGWLSEVLDGLEIERAHLVGASYGGWVAMHHAIHAPERVERMVLLGPMGIPDVTLRVVSRLTMLVLFPSEARREGMIRWTLGPDPFVNDFYADYMRVAMQARNRIAIPKRLSDGALASIGAPTLLMLAADDGPIGNPQPVERRALRHIASLETVVFPGTGHVMSTERADDVNRRILEFLNPGAEPVEPSQAPEAPVTVDATITSDAAEASHGCTPMLRVWSATLGDSLQLNLHSNPAASAATPITYIFAGPLYWGRSVRLPQVADSLAGRGEIPPMRFVGLPPLDAAADLLAHVLREELVPQVEARLGCTTCAEQRTLLAFSANANHAVSLGVTQPGLFVRIAAQSPGWMLWDARAQAIARVFVEDALREIEQPAAGSLPRFWFVWGDGPSEWESRSRIHGQRVLHALRARGAEVTDPPSVPGDHGLELVRYTLPSALRFLAVRVADAAGSSEWPGGQPDAAGENP